MASLITRMVPRASAALARPAARNTFAAQARFFSEGSSYDIFQKIQDPPTEETGAAKRRKPSDKVVRLVDEIMNLTLIEAADLCDLCQEQLAERSGAPDFRGQAAAGRTPFPHPSAMFAASNVGMMAPPMGMPMMGMMPPMMGGMPQMQMGAAPAAPAAAAPAAAAPAAEAPAAEAPAAAAPKKEEKKATYTLRLLGFDAAKKVGVIKEIRAITNLGLKESKDMVEGAPKIVSKTIKAEDVEALKAKLEAAGAQVAFE